jgi:hypothetical protein
VADSASLTLSVSIGGLSDIEAHQVLGALPPGAILTVNAIQPGLGGRRYQMTARELSIQGAAELTGALLEHVRQVAS